MDNPAPKNMTFLVIFFITGGIIFLFWEFLTLYFTAEDFTFIYLYHRMPFFELFTEPNLKAVVVDLYRPVTDLIIYLETKLFGSHAFWWHLVNLCLHGATVYLLFRVSRWVIGFNGALCAALLLAFHPILPGMFSFNVGGIQSGFLLFFTLLSFDQFARFRMLNKRSGMWWSAFFLFCAVGAYEWFSLPLALVFYDLALPRDVGFKARLYGILHHIPGWILVGLLILARKLVLGVYLGGYPLPISREYILSIPSAFLVNLEEYCLNPVMNGMMSRTVRNMGRILLIGAMGLPLIYWLIRGRYNYMRTCVFLLLCFLCVCAPIMVVTTHDPASARRFYGPMAFCAILMALAISGGRTRAAQKPHIPLALAGVLALFYGGITHQIRPFYIQAGNLTRTIQNQILEMVENDQRYQDKLLFLYNTPATINHKPTDQSPQIAVAKAFQFGLSMAFSPPFCDKDLKVYPVLPSIQHFCPDSEVMLTFTKDCKVLRFDGLAQKVRPYVFDGRVRDLLFDYKQTYDEPVGERKVLAPYPVYEPKDGHGLYYISGKGINLFFPKRNSKYYRVVVLTQHYPFMTEYERRFKPNKKPKTRHTITDKHIRVEKIVNRHGKQEERPCIRINYHEEIVQDSLAYFNRQPVFFWIETLDKNKKIQHRSDLIRITLISDKWRDQ